MRGRLLNLPAIARAVGFALVAVAIACRHAALSRGAHHAAATTLQVLPRPPIRSLTN